MKNNNKKAFTLVELIVSIMIIAILSSVGFVSYLSNLSNARNSTRTVDMGNIKISLTNHKQKNGLYPVPGNYFAVTNSGTIILQGFLNISVMTQELVKRPTDPFNITQYYPYSITSNRQSFQIAMSIEDNEVEENSFGLRAFVDGDYQTVSPRLVPSLVFASVVSGTGTLASLSGTFIVDKGTYNIPYNEDKTPYSVDATTLSGIISQVGVIIPEYCGYSNCTDILSNFKNMGPGEYCILNSDGLTKTSTGCTF